MSGAGTACESGILRGPDPRLSRTRARKRMGQDEVVSYRFSITIEIGVRSGRPYDSYMNQPLPLLEIFFQIPRGGAASARRPVRPWWFR